MNNLKEILKTAKREAKKRGFNIHVIESATINGKDYSFTQTPIRYHLTMPNERFIKTVEP